MQSDSSSFVVDWEMMSEACELLRELVSTIPAPQLDSTGTLSKKSEDARTLLKSCMEGLICDYNKLSEQYDEVLSPVWEAAETEQQTEKPGLTVVCWQGLPLELEDLGSQWENWFSVQMTIREMIMYHREIKDEKHPDHDSFGNARDLISQRILRLLEFPKPLNETPIRDVVRRCWDAATWAHGPEDTDPVEDGLVYQRAAEAERVRLLPIHRDAQATNCFVPNFVPREEWPLWRYDEKLFKHVKNKNEGALRDGPCWVPNNQWNRWKKHRLYGWVPKSPDEQDTSEWAYIPARGWILKAILQEEAQRAADARARELDEICEAQDAEEAEFRAFHDYEAEKLRSQITKRKQDVGNESNSK